MKKQTAEFDPSTLDLEGASERGAEFELKHPQTGVPLGIFFRVLGPDSKKAQQVQADLRRMAITDPTEDDKEIQRRSSRATAETMTGWRQGDQPTMMWKGQRREFTVELAAEIFNAQRWMRDQTDAFQFQRRNFSTA